MVSYVYNYQSLIHHSDVDFSHMVRHLFIDVNLFSKCLGPFGALVGQGLGP